MNKHEPPLEPALRPMSRIGSIFGSTFRVAAHHLPIEIHAVLAQSRPCTILSFTGKCPQVGILDSHEFCEGIPLCITELSMLAVFICIS